MRRVNFFQFGSALLIALLHFSNLAFAKKSSESDSLHLNLKEITVQASFLKERQSPLRVNTIDRGAIEKRAVGFTFPELFKDLPGLYATSESGSYGDARVNIRGFKQENISVLLNGIPISGLVTANMFWNNWMGLADATHSIQVQKGIGASMLSDNSVGGTINIITKGTEAKAGGSVGLYGTSYGLLKSALSFNSGESSRGWALSATATYSWGEGYPDASSVNSWAYLLSISKRINQNHSLLLTAMGSPERHQQRSARLNHQEIEQYGLRYNKNWGYYRGEPLNLSENFYHKPYLTLHHFYTINPKLELSNALYLTVGHGGGRWSESKGAPILTYREGALIDWERVEEINRESGASENILADYIAGHTQIGLKSNLAYSLNNHLTLQGGVHLQHYTTWEREVITDLLGGEFWFEDYEKNSLAGVAGREAKKGVGDLIRTYNGKIIEHQTYYFSGQYSDPKWEVIFGASYMRSGNQRWDSYNYPTNPYSERAIGQGYSVKGGANRKIDQSNSLYLNLALYSRVPYHNLFFSSGNNNITENIKNESNIVTEGGYRYLFDRGSIELTLYYTWWKNRSITSNPYKQEDMSNSRYLIRGLDALHKGVEISANWTPHRLLALTAFGSFGDWRWKSDLNATIYNPYSGLIEEVVTLYSDGLPVGDAPQTQLIFIAETKLPKGLSFEANWSYNGRMYADFDPKERKESGPKVNPFRIPSYSLINLGLNWRVKRSIDFELYARVNNLLNRSYIERGKDGADHTISSFSGFWGAGRNGAIGIKMLF